MKLTLVKSLPARWLILFSVLVLVSLVLIGCRRSQPDENDVEPTATVVVVQTVEVTRVVEVTPPPFSQPHPLLGDARIRQAIAHCIDRDALLAAVYPYLPDDARADLRRDSFLPKAHWAYAAPYADGAFDLALAGSLLDEAGWTMSQGDLYRRNAAGEVLTLKLTTTDAPFRQRWAQVAEENLRECGVQLVRLHTPASWWLGADSGLQRRDFELGAYAEASQFDPGGRSRYACDQIPLPGNGWQGENYSGWCNPEADRAVIAAASTFDRAKQVQDYEIVQRQFAADVPALPLFGRAEAEAWTLRLSGPQPNPTEFSTAFIAEWEATDGEPIRIGLLDEPETMLIDGGTASPSQRQIAQIGLGSLWTQADYDFQPRTQTPISTVENGLATMQMVEVKSGDRVFAAAGVAETLGAGALSLPQLTVTYRFADFLWSDGVPASSADIELAHKFACRDQAAPMRPAVCNAIQDVVFGPGMQATVTYLPGYADPAYFLAPWPQLYPGHLPLSDGRVLADAPPVEWPNLPELNERRVGYGPYVLTNWSRGERMEFEANPHYTPAPMIGRIVVEFISNPEQAVVQLLAGELDFLDKALLAEHEMQMISAAARQGEVNLGVVPGPLWERLDMNLSTR